MQYRHEDGPLTEITVQPGAIVVTLSFDIAGAHTKLHSHAFDHWMECVSGAARIVIDGKQSVLKPGEDYLVEAHQQHSVWPLTSNTVLRCIHRHDDIQPGLHDGIPLEWLRRLTDQEPAHARG